jgi:flagellar hook-associated protein 1 FlgK
MDEFWEGWRSLEADPTNSVLRTELLERTKSLASSFQGRVTQLEMLRSDLDKRLEPLVADVNSSAERLAQLNKEILAIQASGNSPNSLIDERNLLLEDLAQKVGATTNFFSNGQAQVMIGTQVLVSGSSVRQLQVAPDTNGLNQVAWKDTSAAVSLPKSEIGAIVDVRDQEIVAQIGDLNKVATTLIARVNNLHRTGFGLNGSTGKVLFTGTDASDIALNTALTAADVAAASATDSPGDGRMAAALANVQNEKLLPGDMTVPDPIPVGWPDPLDTDNSLTLHAAYNNRITKLGLDIKAADKNSSSRQLVLDTLEQQRQSISGVSLDEEAANLARYQRTYQAAARLMTAMDEMLDRVINGMGRVGL